MKAASTTKKELRLLVPLQQWWGGKNPGAVTLADCDGYRKWRNSGGFVSTFALRGKPKTKPTRGGDRIVDMELNVLSNVMHLALRRGRIRTHPLMGRGKYVCAQDIRHCREAAPNPENLERIERWLRGRNEHDVADAILFMAFSGLRIGEALQRRWSEVDWQGEKLDVKRGIFPWVSITTEFKTLLMDMQRRRDEWRRESGLESDLLFPSPINPSVPCDHSYIRSHLTAACKALKIKHVIPHGLRSFYVTSAREAGVTDAEIAMLIGDKSGPQLIASTYGDVRPEHLVKQAQRIKFRPRNV